MSSTYDTRALICSIYTYVWCLYLCQNVSLKCFSSSFSTCLYVCMPVCLSVCLSAYLYVCLSAYLSACHCLCTTCICLYVPPNVSELIFQHGLGSRHTCLPFCLSVCLIVCLSVCLSVCMYVSLYVCLCFEVVRC